MPPDGNSTPFNLIPPNIPILPPAGVTYGTMEPYCGFHIYLIGAPSAWGGNKYWTTINGVDGRSKTFYVSIGPFVNSTEETEELNKLKSMISTQVGDKCGNNRSAPKSETIVFSGFEFNFSRAFVTTPFGLQEVPVEFVAAKLGDDMGYRYRVILIVVVAFALICYALWRLVR